MTSTTFADRSAAAAGSALPLVGKASRTAAALLTSALARLRGTPDPQLDDHLLQDIGLTRADYEALRD